MIKSYGRHFAIVFYNTGCSLHSVALKWISCPRLKTKGRKENQNRSYAISF